jgi:hypothetical protein
MIPAAEPAPPGIRLESYVELEQMARAFADGHFNLLVLVVSPALALRCCSLGKSRSHCNGSGSN